jgi:hypothetical protein
MKDTLRLHRLYSEDTPFYTERRECGMLTRAQTKMAREEAEELVVRLNEILMAMRDPIVECYSLKDQLTIFAPTLSAFFDLFGDCHPCYGRPGVTLERPEMLQEGILKVSKLYLKAVNDREEQDAASMRAWESSQQEENVCMKSM